MRYRSFAKVNVFLKITAKRGAYHELISRFCLVRGLYDEIEFVPSRSGFDIEGVFDCPLKENIIYRAYKELQSRVNSETLKEFFSSHKVLVDKRIPAGAGLGGGSSNAATFLNMLREVDSSIAYSEIESVARSIGSDVVFFLKGYGSANVSGVGEVVEEFVEETPEFEVVTPPVFCKTPLVYKEFRESFYKECRDRSLLEKSSRYILSSGSIDELNDLFTPALSLYKELQEYVKDGWFFSGSGSSFFRIKS